MNLKPQRTLVILALYAGVGSFASAALAADGDGAETFDQTRARAEQQAPPVQQQLAARRESNVIAPTVSTGHTERRDGQLQSLSSQVNVPGNPAFGRVATR